MRSAVMLALCLCLCLCLCSSELGSLPVAGLAAATGAAAATTEVHVVVQAPTFFQMSQTRPDVLPSSTSRTVIDCAQMVPVSPVLLRVASACSAPPNMLQASAEHATPTRPRLQSVNQDFSDLNEQIRQVAHIIRLPHDWAHLGDESERSAALQHVVRARAEWVLRWILDKLKDEAAAGSDARANPTTWQLLECMIYILPVSRSAPHLRDASLTTVLEKSLVENFDKALVDASTPTSLHVHMQDAPESSDTIQDDTQPSRKRKRGTPETSPSKKAALGTTEPALLFRTMRTVLTSITRLATTSTNTHDSTQSELMKMVLRTEGPQASRILKFWLIAVQKLITRILASDADVQTLTSLVDISAVLEIWELRIIDSSDTAASSSEDFTNECLVPVLQLAETIRSLRTHGTGRVSTRVLDSTMQIIDKLLIRHLLAPSRSAFFAETHMEAGTKDFNHTETSALSSNLGPLRAMLLQAVQIEDASEPVPPLYTALFKALGYLLDLAVRASPSRTPKSRLVERPWIQAVFLSLAECVGCSLKAPPEFMTPKAAVAAIQSALEVLQLHNVTMDSAMVSSLFWYHCGVKHPQHVEKEVHWDLIATLIKLDPSVFVAESRTISDGPKENGADLAEFLFEQISNTEFKGRGFADTNDGPSPDSSGASFVHTDDGLQASRQLILDHIIGPMMSAFSRNRNLLGFLRRWDDQLVKSYKYENRKAAKERAVSIWEDRVLTRNLSGLFEQSLTQGQIAKLLEEHTTRMGALGGALTVQAEENVNIRKLAAYKKACSSAIILFAILQAVQTDDIITALRPQLHLLFVLYAQRIQDNQYSAHTRLASSWLTLCQLTTKLWPIEMHASLQVQQSLLYPLIEQATIDMSAGRKDSGNGRTDSLTRAAAMLFLLDACDRLQTVTGSKEIVQDSLRKIIKSLSVSQLETKDHTIMVEIFCARFVQLLGHLHAQAAQESFVAMLARLSTFDIDVGEHMSRLLSQSVFREGSPALQNAFSSSLLDIFGQNDDVHLHHVAIQAFLCVQPSALSRERREAILDRLSTLLSTGPSDAIGLLGVMVQLMAVPNASAKISTNGATIFDIASQLQVQGKMSRTLLQQLQYLCQRTLGHIIPNQSQAQSRALLGEYQKKLNTLSQGTKQVSMTGLAILRATILEQKDSQLLSVKQYVGLLKQCLTDDGTVADDTASLEDVLDAFNELYPTLLGDLTLFKSTVLWLQKWINENADLESYITASNSISVEVAEYVARLHTIVARYRLYPSVKWLIALTVKLIREPIAAASKRSALATVTEVLIPLETAEKLELVPMLTGVENPLAQSASYRILNNLISTVPDKLSGTTIVRQKQLAIIPRLCLLVVEATDDASFNALMDGIDTILNNKTSLATQHSIECVLGALAKLISRTSPALSATNAEHIFTRLCETSRLMLLVHRSKLGGRSHMLIPLLQGLLFCLFVPTSARSGALPTWLRSNTPIEPVRLTSVNAGQYTRLLSTLCNPPQSSISKSHQHSRKSKDLNDPIKAARERTSYFLYPLLASFCRFQLAGRLVPEVRTKLMPGLWEVVGTASLHKEGIDAMFAGLSRSERDVWRSVWGEWESVHGRKERFLDGDDA
jgi:nucleolar pre-ribosomal-associated protein 2